jgi:hypothetical protein
MKDKERVTSQQLKALDEALAVYIYVFPDALAASCLKVAGCPELKMQFSRLIKNMRETGTWEPIVMATKARAAPALAFHFADELMDGCQALPVPRPPVEHTAKDMHSRCDRFGDGEAYGQHGPKGMYREGIKLYTTLIAAGTVSPALASRELEGMGIRVSAWTLGQRAKEQPGKSPTSVKAPWVPQHMSEQLYAKVKWMRSHNLPVTKAMVFAELGALIDNTEYKQRWKDFDSECHDKWYYNWLDKWDATTSHLKPLEAARDMWEKSSNMFAQNKVWALEALRIGSATKNPAFDWEKPFCENEPYLEPIFWTAQGLKGLSSMDETDVRTDQTKRAMAQSMRSVQLQEAGTSAGHGKHQRFKGNHPYARPRAKTKVVDEGAKVATKMGGHTSFAGGSRGDGESFAPQVLSDKALAADVLKHAPEGTVLVWGTNAAGEPCLVRQQAQYVITPSGGMTTDAMIAYGDYILKPSWEAAGVTGRRLHLMDGLQDHCCYEVAVHYDTVLNCSILVRAPHTSRRCATHAPPRTQYSPRTLPACRSQKEDFQNFAQFQPAHDKAKMEMQVSKVEALSAAGTALSAANYAKEAQLTLAEGLECAKIPWQNAFAPPNNIKGWAKEGVVPFTMKVAWDMLAEERAKGEAATVIPNTTPAFAYYGLPTPDPISRVVPSPHPITTLTFPPAAAEDVAAEAERRQAAGEVPKQKKMRVTSADLFKLQGSITGPDALALLREKSVQKQMAAADADARKEARQEKKDTSAAQLPGLANQLLRALALQPSLHQRAVSNDHLAAFLKLRRPSDDVPRLKADRMAAVEVLLGGPSLDNLPAAQEWLSGIPAAPLALPAPSVAEGGAEV